MPAYDYDLFVIGAGSGGVRAARLAGALGKRVAVAEDNRLGGTCVNRGCIPKKLYSYAAHYAEDFEDAAGFGWTVGERSFDWSKLVAAKEKELTRLGGIYAKVLTDNKVLGWGWAHYVEAMEQYKLPTPLTEKKPAQGAPAP